MDSADPAASTAFYPQSAFTGNSTASVSPSVLPAASASPSAPNAGTQTPLPAYNASCGTISEMVSDLLCTIESIGFVNGYSKIAQIIGREFSFYQKQFQFP